MARALALLVLLLSSFTVFGEELETLPPTTSPHYPVAAPPHHHHHHPHPHPPTPAPVHPPKHAPIHPPSLPPVHPPSHHHHHHHHPPAPTPAPVHPPTPMPVHPPTHHYPPHPAPVKPPVHPPVPVRPPVPVHPPVLPPKLPPKYPPVHPFPRSFVAVQGVVYIKSCKYAGVETLLGATPALGAIVKLQCNNTRYPLVQTAKTDKNGYFFVQAPKSITTFGAHKCKVFLVTSPDATKPSNLHGGVVGAALKPEKPFSANKLPFLLYSVGPLAFEPKCPKP